MIAQLDKYYIQTNPNKVIPRLISYLLFEGRPVTTKGTWINPVLFLSFYCAKHMPQIKEIKKPIFIVGTGRSGTSILGVILSMHSDVGFLNEPKALWHSLYEKEDVIGSYSKGKAYYRLFKNDVTKKIKRDAKRILSLYLAITRSNRIVDKYPELIFRLPFVKEIFPDAKFIFLVRNGWDACSSIEKWSKRNSKQVGQELHDWWGVDNRKWKIMIDELLNNDPYFSKCIKIIKKFNSHTDMAIVEWIITMREGLKQIEKYKNCMYKLKYENLVKQPMKEISNLLKFCELCDDQNMYSYANEVLRKCPPHSTFKIHPQIYPLFKETMIALGYQY